MTIGYILTPEQQAQIQGKFYSDSQFFNCVADINGVWYLFLSQEDKEEVFTNMQWHWTLDLPQGEYTPPPPPPFPY